MMLAPPYPVQVRPFGAVGDVTAPLPSYCGVRPAPAVLAPGFTTFAVFASGLLSVTALLLEHRGYKHASVAVLVGTGVVGAFLTAIRWHCAAAAR